MDATKSDENMRQTVRQILVDSDLLAYMPTINQLAALGKPAVPALIDMLIDAKQRNLYGDIAARALGKIGDLSALPYLLLFYKTEDNRIGIAYHAILDLGKPAFPGMLEELKNPAEPWAFARLLVELNCGTEAIAALWEFMKNEPSARNRYSRTMSYIQCKMLEVGKNAAPGNSGANPISFEGLELKRFPLRKTAVVRGMNQKTIPAKMPAVA